METKILTKYFLLAALVAAGSPAALAAEDAIETFHGRGVSYFAGSIRCPLAGVGTRDAKASNRIVLDDEHSTVTVDRTRRRITFRNTRRYLWRKVVGDVLFLGVGTAGGGERSPFGIHVKVSKWGRRMTASVHPHPTTRDRIARAEFDRYEVMLDDGDGLRVGIVPEKAERTILEPAFASRVANYLLQVRDRLAGKTLQPDRAGARLVDLSIGFGVPALALGVARVELRSLDSANAPLIRRGALTEMLTSGSWQLRLHARTPILKTEFDRDLFLFGLDDIEMLSPLKWRGLLPGEDLIIGYDQGRGFVEFRGERAEIPNPADVARAYLEFHLLGGIVARQIATLPFRLQASPAAPPEAR